MSPVYFFISYLRLGLPLHVPRVLLHILSSFGAPTPCPPCTSSYPIFVWGSHSMSPVYFFISYLRLGLPLHVPHVLLHILSSFGAPIPCPPCTSSYPIFVWGSHSMSPVYFFISYLRLGLPLHVPHVLLHILSSFGAPIPCPPCTSSYPIFVWGSHSMSPMYFFISYLRLGLPLHVPRVLLHILSSFGAPTPCPPCTSSYPIFVWGSHSMSPVYFFISYLRLGLPLHVPRVLLHILSSFGAPTPCPPCTSSYPIFVWGSHSMSPVYFFISYLRLGLPLHVPRVLLGHSMSDQRVFCNDLLRFPFNLACLLTFNILTKMPIFSYVSRALFEI